MEVGTSENPIFLCVTKTGNNEINRLLDILRSNGIKIVTTSEEGRSGGISVISFPAVYTDTEAIIFLKNLARKIDRKSSHERKQNNNLD